MKKLKLSQPDLLPLERPTELRVYNLEELTATLERGKREGFVVRHMAWVTQHHGWWDLKLEYVVLPAVGMD